MLCMAMLLACCSSAAFCNAAPPGRKAAADAALAEALAYFGAGPGLGADAGWRLERLDAALEGAGFHRRRRYELVLQHGSASNSAGDSGSGHESAWLERPKAPPGQECCGGAPGLGWGHTLEQLEHDYAPLGGERCHEAVACEAAVLQVTASTSSRQWSITSIQRTL